MNLEEPRIFKSVLGAMFKYLRTSVQIISCVCKSPHSLERNSSSSEVSEFFRLFAPFDTGHKLIRVGLGGDGGYLIPEDISQIGGCFSPGVGSTSAFENDLANRFNIRSWLLDDSVSRPVDLHVLNSFEKLKLGLDSITDVSISLENWVNKSTNLVGSEYILQMDIESHEWQILLSTPLNVLTRFRIMVIEFHSLPLARLPYVLDRVYLPTLKKLLLNFDVVHVHPNNSVGTFAHSGIEYPDTIEVTFLRKDRRLKYIKLDSVINELDSPCDPSKVEIAIDQVVI